MLADATIAGLVAAPDAAAAAVIHGTVTCSAAESKDVVAQQQAKPCPTACNAAAHTPTDAASLPSNTS